MQIRYRRLKNKGRALVVLVNGVPALRLQRFDEDGDPLALEEYGIDVADVTAKVAAMEETLRDLRALLADCVAVLASAPAAATGPAWPDEETTKNPAG